MFGSLQEKDDAENLLSKKNLMILAISMALAVGYDVLFVQPPAVAAAYPLFLLGLLAATYINSKSLLTRPPSFGWFLVFPLIMLALTRFLFTNEVFCTLNSLVIPVMFMAHVLLVTDSSRYDWTRLGFLQDIAKGLVIRPFQYITKPLAVIRAWVSTNNEASDRRVFVKVLTGIIIFLPIIIVVIMLLSSADKAFEFFLRSFLSHIDFNEIAKNSLWIGMLTLLAFSFLWSLNNTKVIKISCTSKAKFFDEIIVISGLCLLTTVYVLFSVIQFSYLFANLYNFLPHDFPYAEYARRGFFELIVVTIINVIIVVASMGFTATSRPLTAKILQGLNSALLLCTFVLLISAYCRMSLYEAFYGYTYLRIFTQSFMIMIFVMLCATFYKVWVDRVDLTKIYLIIGIVAYVLINYVNVDTIIAQKNMERYYQTGKIDVDYLAGLSDDAIPYLAALARDPNWKVERPARQHIAEKQERLAVNKAWQGYNLSEQRAKSFLAENPVPPRVFDSALWKRDKFQRAIIVYDLLTTQNLTGKSKAQIMDLLGNPEFADEKAAYYAWPLWSASSLNGWDQKLWIKFGVPSIVSSYGIENRQ